MPPLKIPEKPLDKIALSCSGGGYRAASFHLGTMSYLNHIHYFNKPLLENVRMISTVSGGTITGAVYALMKQDGKSFEEIYNFLMDKLRNLDLVKLSLEKMSPGGIWHNQNKRRNLINAFAELYDTHFTHGRTFTDFATMNSHLESVVFNCTDFSHGLNFRFRNSDSSIFGNKNNSIRKNVAKEVKIADAIASSACFPGGFEPMVWPDDYTHAMSPGLENLKQSGKKLGIMDGGIFDNQGINSILSYKSKKNTEAYFDLVLLSDVSSPDMAPFQPYPQSSERKSIWKLNIKTFVWFYTLLDKQMYKILLGICLLSLIWPWSEGFEDNIFTGVCLSVFVFSMSLLLIKWFLNSRIRRLKTAISNAFHTLIPQPISQRLKYLKIDDIPLLTFVPLMMDRASSVLILLKDVFLKIVRRQNYNKLYENNLYENRRIGILIKTLTLREENHQRSVDRPKQESFIQNSIIEGVHDVVVGKNIREVAESAASFGTTLWFTDQEQTDKVLDKLVASGQFTTCFKFLEYLEILIYGNIGFETLSIPAQTELKQLLEKCKSDWLKFKNDPMWLINRIT